ncbi:MAG: DNA repair exonuclease [Clostridia bacterium]|nr:DNA repair exonuclease [Clostridia bacterium]
MEEFCFVHAADIHLDSPFAGVGSDSPELAAAFMGSTRQSLRSICDLCVNSNAAFLVLAGDVFDGAQPGLRAQLELHSCVRRLAGHGIHTYIAHGNHDPLSTVCARLDWPREAHFFSDEVQSYPVVARGRELAEVQGISYSRPVVTDNLAKCFAKRPGSPFAIGVLHANVGGLPGHENYAPCTIDDLIATGIDYWALGHVHTHVVLRAERPVIAYPGCAQGRNPRESGEHGCCLVHVDSCGDAVVEFTPTDRIRWHTMELSIDGMSSIDELLAALDSGLLAAQRGSDGRSCVARVRLAGRGPLHSEISRGVSSADLLAAVREARGLDGGLSWSDADRFIWVESVVDDTAPEVDRGALVGEGTLVSDFLNLVDEARAGGDQGLLASIRTALASDLKRHKQAFTMVSNMTDEEILSLLNRAESIGLDLLLGEEAGV